RAYRLVVLRKDLEVLRGEQVVGRRVRYFFFITNLPKAEYAPAAVVPEANDRCDQENLIEQLKDGVRALRMPCGDLVSNGAYMVVAGLAWSLKAWAGLLLPAAPGPWAQRHEEQGREVVKMDFRRFAEGLIGLPCQVV